MVRRVNGTWVCEECGLRYKNKMWAERCEKWCKEHKSCNLEITRHAVKEVKHGSLLRFRFIDKILLIFGGVAAVLGTLGALGLCCVPLVVGFFALFGISSAAFLMTYNKLFLFLAVASFALLVYYMKVSRACKT